MITFYSLQNKNVIETQATNDTILPLDAIWIDLYSPTDDERIRVSKTYNQALPSEQDVLEIEASSRFFFDEQGLHLRTYFLHQFPDRYENITVAFIVNQGRLFTIRHEKLETMHAFKQKAATGTMHIKDNFDLLFSLFEIKVDRLADNLEILHSKIETISKNVYDGDNRKLEEIVLQLGTQQDINDKMRLGLLDMQRLFSFLKRNGHSTGKNSKTLNNLIRDIESLMQYTTYLFEKSDSLLSVTMGLMSSEQNKVIKIFSIISVVFMPPTLVASIYGMNFTIMPELSWQLGYFFALGLMLGSAILPYLFFRAKGWL
jgi:magnesium transporter